MLDLNLNNLDTLKKILYKYKIKKCLVSKNFNIICYKINSDNKYIESNFKKDILKSLNIKITFITYNQLLSGKACGVSEDDLNKLEIIHDPEQQIIYQLMRTSSSKIFKYYKTYSYTKEDVYFDAILMNIQRLGEYSKRLRGRKLDIDYTELRDIRNLISHNYDALNDTIISNFILSLHERNAKIKRILR